MIKVPLGFKVAGVHCGIKRNPNKEDVALVVSDRPCAAAGVYTQNLVFAAPVKLNRSRTPSDRIRFVVINSGNANACTGERGDRDALEMARLAASAVELQPEDALVLSTGIIGEFLPLEKIGAGIQAAAGKLGTSEEVLVSAARGMLTTDTRHKLAGRTLRVGGRQVQITGMAKGAAMIGPNMATMLCLLMTDAPLTPGDAQRVLFTCVNDSFNCISVEGHMSTNDTVLLVANGAAGGSPLIGANLNTFQEALHEVCVELARSIPEDGEGVSHVITVDVTGCATRDDAHKIAQNVANSPLVKTAIAGADPNWGRIVSAAGYAGVSFNPEGVSLKVNGHLLYENGAPVRFDGAAVSQSIRSQRDTSIELSFREGPGAVRFWTTDLTIEYVKLNADYHT